MTVKAPQIYTISTEETRNVSVDMSGQLDSGELLTGSPTVQCSASLKITNEQVNSAEVEIGGVSVAIGRAVQFKVACSVQGNYPVEVKVTTDAGQTIEGEIQINVRPTKLS